MTVRVEVLPSGDLKYPWKVRVTTRDEHGRLVGARHLRAFTEGEAEKIAASLNESDPHRGRAALGHRREQLLCPPHSLQPKGTQHEGPDPLR